MKKLLGSFCILLYACSDTPQPSPVTVSVLRDRTDSNFILKPDAEAILKLFGLEEHKEGSARFRYAEIKDQVLGASIDIELSDAAATEKHNKQQIPLFREQAIVSFYDTVRNVIKSSNDISDAMTLQQSTCFEKIASELTAIKESTEKSILLVYSNLFQNSPMFSVYDRAVQQELYEHPERMIQQMRTARLLPDTIRNTTIVFLYQPSRDEEKLYMQMGKVFTSLLQERGAKVVLQTSNTFRNL